MRYDIAVIGAGSAGLSVAAAAAQFGEKVVLFEKSDMGGDCLNTGCVPSKALLAAAKQARTHRTSSRFGVVGHEPDVDFAKVMDHVQRVIDTIAPFDSQARFEGLGVNVVRAGARFTGRRTLEAGGETFEARRIIIATGSRAALPPIPGLADVPHFTNETIFKNRTRPEHLIIIGGGPIGLEMAQAHRRLGSAVTVLEAAKPLARDDPELGNIVLAALADEGITIRSGVKIEKATGSSTGIAITLADGSSVEGSHLLVAAGRKPNIEGLNLEAAGIAFTSRGIGVDHAMRTSNRHVYAAGDVAGGLQFTHVASYHAGLIIRNALFRLPVSNRAELMPWVTYTDPELAHVGLSEMEARNRHGDAVKTLKWSFEENDRAVAEGKPAGLVKLVVGRRGKILGASIVGAGAGELIAIWCMAISKGLKVSDIANLVLPYPTLNEAGKRAALSYYASFPRAPLVRGLIGFLKRFG